MYVKVFTCMYLCMYVCMYVLCGEGEGGPENSPTNPIACAHDVNREKDISEPIFPHSSSAVGKTLVVPLLQQTTFCCTRRHKETRRLVGSTAGEA